MVKVKYYGKKRKYILSIKGHANSSEKTKEGYDLVCGAVSTLAITLAQCVANAKDKLVCEPTIKIQKGDTLISCEALRHNDKEIMHLFYVAGVGFAILEEQYPDFVSFYSE